MKGLGRVVVGSVLGSLLGAASFFVMDGLMLKAAVPLPVVTDANCQG